MYFALLLLLLSLGLQDVFVTTVWRMCVCADIPQKMSLRISSVGFQGSGHPTAVPRANFRVMAVNLALHSPSKRR